MKHYTPSYHTLNKPMNGKILKAIDSVRDDYSENHSKMLTMRMDVHLPEGTDQSRIMAFNHRFIESQKNKGYDPAYVMVREVSDEGRTHYHMALFLNGQKIESTYYVFKDAERILSNAAIKRLGFSRYYACVRKKFFKTAVVPVVCVVLFIIREVAQSIFPRTIGLRGLMLSLGFNPALAT